MAAKPENPLENVLKNIISGIAKKGGLTEEEVRSAWDGAVGEKAAKHSRPRTLKGSRLIVHIDDSSWLYELTVRKKEILKSLGEILKNNKIKDITLRIGELK
jgi:predicted nucleic acid-binding Zn ribbon protein